MGPQEEEILHWGPFYFDIVLNDWMEDFFFHIYCCCSEEFCQVLHFLWNCFWRRGKVICIDPLEFAFCSWQHKQNSIFQTHCKLRIDFERATPRAKFNKEQCDFFYIRSYIIIIVSQISESKRFLYHISYERWSVDMETNSLTDCNIKLFCHLSVWTRSCLYNGGKSCTTLSYCRYLT